MFNNKTHKANTMNTTEKPLYTNTELRNLSYMGLFAVAVYGTLVYFWPAVVWILLVDCAFTSASRLYKLDKLSKLPKDSLATIDLAELDVALDRRIEQILEKPKYKEFFLPAPDYEVMIDPELVKKALEKHSKRDL